MGRILTISDVPGHFDGEGAQIDRCRHNPQSHVVSKTAADEAWKRRAIVGHRDHLGDGQEVGDGHCDVTTKILPLKSLEQAGPQSAGRQDIYVPQSLELFAREPLPDAWMVRPHDASEAVIHEMLHDQVVRRIEDATYNQCCRARNDARFN